MGKLKKEVLDLDGLRFMMNMLKEVRQRESGINMEINPIMNMYQAREPTMTSVVRGGSVCTILATDDRRQNNRLLSLY